MTTSESSVHHGARTPILLITATLVLAVLYYFGRADTIGVFSGDRGWHVMTPGVRSARLHYLLSALLLGIVPLVVTRLACGIRLRELGLGLGRWREGLIWLAIGVPLAVLAGKIAAGQSAMQAVYPLDSAIGPGWEFLPYDSPFRSGAQRGVLGIAGEFRVWLRHASRSVDLVRGADPLDGRDEHGVVHPD